MLLVHRLQRHRRPTVALAALAVLLLAASGWLAGPASAHSGLVRVVPGEGATVTTMPREVRLVFDEDVRPPADVVVTGPDGARVDRGLAAVQASTVTVRLDTGDGSAGTYTVAYRVVSADGHPVAGETTWTLAPGGTAAPGATHAAAHSPHADGGGGISRTRAIGIGAGAALLVGLALLTVRRLPGGLVDPRDPAER